MSNTVPAADTALPSLSKVIDEIGGCERLLCAARLAVEGAAFENPNDTECIADLIAIIQSKLLAAFDDAWRLHEAQREA